MPSDDMRDKWIRIIVFCWTVISVFIIYYLQLTSKTNYVFHSITSPIYISTIKVAIIIFPGLILWIAYEMLLNKRWAIIVILIFYTLTSFNFFTGNFELHLKMGFDFVISFSDEFSINLINLFCLILLFIEIRKNKKMPAANSGHI
jgi:hypothetical protein